MEYLTPFERLTELMTSLDGFDVPAIYQALREICLQLRVSKGVTAFYLDPEHEQRGQGEQFVCYDSGEDHVLVSHLRKQTIGSMVVVCDVYQARGAQPFDETELKRVQTVQRMMLTYLNRSRQEEILQRLMYWDDDGYNNLRYFYMSIMRLKAAGKLKGRVAMRINLRHFSLVNEQLGKEAGDVIMRRYSEQLKSAMGTDGVFCRLGGDNYVALFDGVHTDQVIGLLRRALVPFDEDKRVELSAVAGLCKIDDPENIHHPGVVMERIINAFNFAKRAQNDNISFYTEEMRLKKERESRVQRLFEQALKDEEFLVYYQPKVDIQTRRLIGAEALCRWMHEGKIIPPLDFIPALERGMDICRLDFYMLRRVCRDIRRWLDEGREVVRVSVNLSRRHMMDPDLFEHIVSIVDECRVPHQYIEIELTETTTDVEFKDLKRVVKGLQSVGISASVDDFGVGYSSLNLIKEIPWDVLKLDKSILPADGQNMERSSRMFAHVIAMAHEIGLKCVAEGVETETQLEIMRHYGCRIAQGFLFDKPLPVSDFEARLSQGHYHP